MPLVYLRWRDTYSYGGWQSEKEIEEIIKSPDWIVESVGWLIFQNDDRIIICQSTSNYKSNSEILKIPAAAIIDIQFLVDPDRTKDDDGD